MFRILPKGHPQTKLTNEKATLGRVLILRQDTYHSTIQRHAHPAILRVEALLMDHKLVKDLFKVGTPRNSMTIVNMFSDETFFWDGRIDNLKRNGNDAYQEPH